MKNFTFLMLILTMTIGLSVSAQVIPNADFEEWEQGFFEFETLVDWESTGAATGSQDIFKVTPGQSGDFAAEIRPLEIAGATELFATFITVDFPVSERFGMFSGYAKGVSAGGDYISILVTMVKDGEAIGYAFKDIEEETTDFTPFSVAIDYTSASVPDEAFIIVTLSDEDGNAHEGSAFAFDNFTLNGIAAITELSPVFGQMNQAYPNPAVSKVTLPFELKQADKLQLSVYDVQGKLVHSESAKHYNAGTNEIALDISSLNQGLYIYKLIPSDGLGFSKTFVVK